MKLKHLILTLFFMLTASHLLAKNYIVDVIPQIRHSTGAIQDIFLMQITYNEDADEYEFKYTYSNYANPPYDYIYLDKLMFEKLSELHEWRVKFNVLDPANNQLRFIFQLEPKGLTGDDSDNIAKFAAAESVSHQFLQCMKDLKFKEATRMIIVHGLYFNCR